MSTCHSALNQVPIQARRARATGWGVLFSLSVAAPYGAAANHSLGVFPRSCRYIK